MSGTTTRFGRPQHVLVTLLLLVGSSLASDPDCDVFIKDIPRDRCNNQKEGYIPYYNIDGAWCSAAGQCKAFSGRFEFRWDFKNRSILGIAPESKYVDRTGFHSRVPQAYDLNGDLRYSDQTLNWAINRVKVLDRAGVTFDWCNMYVVHNWPWKSVIKTKQGDHIYLYGNMACQVTPGQNKAKVLPGGVYFAANKRLAYNTKSLVLINLPGLDDYIGVISGAVLFQCTYRLTDNALVVDPTSSGLVIPPQGFDRYSKICIRDLVPTEVKTHCGYAGTTTADMDFVEWEEFHINQAEAKQGYAKYFIPRHPSADYPIVVHARSNSPRMTDGENANKRLIFTVFDVKLGPDAQQRHMGYFAPSKYWNKTDLRNAMTWKVYAGASDVDDIAFVPCGKSPYVLMVLGNYYRTVPYQDFHPQRVHGEIRPISWLDAFELINSIYLNPREDEIWTYHRANYIARAHYQCQGGVVFASRKGDYMFRRQPDFVPYTQGFGRFSAFLPPVKFQEEKVWRDLGVFEGLLIKPEPPNPKLFESDALKPSPYGPVSPPVVTTIMPNGSSTVDPLPPIPDDPKPIVERTEFPYGWVIAGAILAGLILSILIWMAVSHRREHKAPEHSKVSSSRAGGSRASGTGAGSRMSGKPSSRSHSSSLSHKPTARSNVTRAHSSGVSRTSSIKPSSSSPTSKMASSKPSGKLSSHASSHHSNSSRSSPSRK